MCGRYALAPDGSLVDRYQAAYIIPGDNGERYNIAPTQFAPVITHEGIENMKWGLVPSWSKQPKTPFSTFNARAEGLPEKPMFLGPFKHHRCLVPATGFYEWRKDEDGRTPFYFHVPAQPVFSMAGLFDEWRDAEGHPLRTFTIVTTKANSLMESIHDRMPVILNPDEETDWLDPEQAPDELVLMLRPFDAGLMERYEVDRAVNSSRGEGAMLITPLNSR